MSGKVKILTSLCATIIMMVVAISSIFAATSASLSINCTVSYTATNYVGTITGNVDGLGLSDLQKTNTITAPFAQTTSWDIPTGAITPDEFGIPNLVVYTFTITNAMNKNGKISVAVAYDDDIFSLITRGAKYYSNAVSSLAPIAESSAFENMSDITIDAQSGGVDGVIKLEFAFKVIEPSKNFSDKSIDFNMELSRVLD